MISYKYKLYTTKHTKFLDNMLREACFVWNHALALQKRYYRIYKRYIPIGKMRKHFSTRIKRTYLYSQSTQEILLRLDYAYLRFFKHISKDHLNSRDMVNFRLLLTHKVVFRLKVINFELNH